MIEIGSHRIGKGMRPLVVAEMSGNHNKSLKRALAIIDAAADAGAHAIKLQTYTADTMTLDLADPSFIVSSEGSLWNGMTLHSLYEAASTPWEWHPDLFAHARRRGLLVFSTPFDISAVDFLEELDAPCYKIASFENTDYALIRRVAATGKPLIISTGMATLSDIDGAVRAAREGGCRQLVLLKCTSTYPSPPGRSNILTIPVMRDVFNCEVGLSDHTPGIGVAIASVALGAALIEKHFTLSRAEGGVDAAFSLEPQELRLLVEESGRAAESLGIIQFEPVAEEAASMQFRRSLYVVEDISAGTPLTPRNIRAIRPGWGLSPKHFEQVIGMRVTRAVARGTPVTWDLFR